MRLVLALAAAAVGSIASALPAQSSDTIAGLRYTMTVTTAVRGSSGGAPRKFVARVIEAAGRGRMDIVEGTFGAEFGIGDYLLFDSTEFVIVRPGSREFTVVPAGLATRSMEMLQAIPGVHLTVGNVTVSLDTIRRVDTIQQLPTRHYRLGIAYEIALDAGIMTDTISTDVRSDFWMADLPGFPPSPFSQFTTAGGGATGPLKQMLDTVTAAAGALRRGVPVKSVSISRMREGKSAPVETEQTMDVTDYRRAAVDAARLVLPPDYRETPMPGLEALPAVPRAPSDSVKWRTRPDHWP